MSRLNDLIQELCPNGVEFKTLGEIAFYVKERIDAKHVNVSNYVGVENLLPNKQGKINSSYVPVEGNLISFKTDDILIGNIRPYLKKIWLASCNGGTNGDVLTIRIQDLNIITPRFLYYLLSSDQFFLYDMQYAKGAKMPRGVKEIILQYRIPLPPLPVQREIVQILDNFTLLTAELTAELTARKKQYEYYRDQLLTFDECQNITGGGNRQDRIQWRPLGEIGLVTKLAGFEFTNYVAYSNTGEIIALRGLNVKNGRLDLTDVKYIDNSDFSKLSRSKLVKGDLLFTYVGTIGQVALIDENEKYYLAPNVAMIRVNQEFLLPRFVMYFFQTKAFWSNQIEKLLQASSMKNIPMEKIRKFVLPIPSLKEQARIVSILDRFDALCNDLTSGLPAEIEARRKQYEYYRDKLLTFQEIES